MKTRKLLAIPLAIIVLVGGVSCSRGTPKPTPATPTQQATPTKQATPTQQATPTLKPTPTQQATPTSQPTPAQTSEQITPAPTSLITSARCIQSVVDVMTIIWTTSVPTVGRLEYSNLSSPDLYGNVTEWSTGPALYGGATVGNLEPYGYYHARVRVKDAAGNESVSDDILVVLYFYTAPTYGQGGPGEGGWGGYL